MKLVGEVPIEAAILKGLGVRAGVPDIIAVHEGRCYAIEIKSEDGRRSMAPLSDALQR
jgi:hypothetical protein